MQIRYRSLEERKKVLQAKYMNGYEVVGKIVVLNVFAGIFLLMLVALLVSFIVKTLNKVMY
jgi:hypothetical protein